MTQAPKPGSPIRTRQIDRREWWLWGFAVVVTLALTTGIVLLTFYGDHSGESAFWDDLREWVRALAALVLLFDIYTMYQHLQLQQVRRQLAERDELFQLITENAADMIAVVDATGKRLYNSPAYERVLGYSTLELGLVPPLEQIHASDRARVSQAAENALTTGRGQRLEYRMRHKDGTWRFLESTASPIHHHDGRMQKLVIVNRDITERKRAEKLLAHQELHDALTDLPNRSLFLDRLQQGLVRARRHVDYGFAVLFVDVDEFKVVNDSLGHSAGDDLLIQIAHRLKTCFRETDTAARPAPLDSTDPVSGGDEVARLGGDEFTVLLEDVLQASDAVRVAQRIQSRLTIPVQIGEQEVVITVSVGITLSGNSYEKAEELLRDAEIAMYRAKATGKACCEVFDPEMHKSAVRRLKLETDLRRAVERGNLAVYYQPIVALPSGNISGFEALSRWPTPDGMVSPAEFIPVADETGLILPINRLLMIEACRQIRSWQEEFACDPPLAISVNVAPRQFAQPDLVQEIAGVLAETGVDPQLMHLEIMETIAMDEPDRALRLLGELKSLGVLLSIDDFGTGHSSLSRLPRFPIDALKIDRAFISEMTSSKDNHEIVRLIIMLAHNIGLKVIAEGAETAEQIGELRRLSCEMAQGYFYSPPVTAAEARGLLRQCYSVGSKWVRGQLGTACPAAGIKSSS